MAEGDAAVHDVQDLISRHRTGSPPSKTPKKEHFEIGEFETPPRAHKESEKSGKFLMRAASKEDPLHFIHRIVKQNAVEEEAVEFLSIIRSVSTSSEGDVETRQTERRNLLTSALVKQFEGGAPKATMDSDDTGESSEDDDVSNKKSDISGKNNDVTISSTTTKETIGTKQVIETVTIVTQETIITKDLNDNVGKLPLTDNKGDINKPEKDKIDENDTEISLNVSKSSPSPTDMTPKAISDDIEFMDENDSVNIESKIIIGASTDIKEEQESSNVTDDVTPSHSKITTDKLHAIPTVDLPKNVSTEEESKDIAKSPKTPDQEAPLDLRIQGEPQCVLTLDKTDDLPAQEESMTMLNASQQAPEPISTPDVVAPNVVTPDVVTPVEVTPDVVTPDVVTPVEVTPDVVAPDVVTPVEVTPDVVTPDVVTPVVVTPDVLTDTPAQEEPNNAPTDGKTKNIPLQVESKDNPPQVESKDIPSEVESKDLPQREEPEVISTQDGRKDILAEDESEDIASDVDLEDIGTNIIPDDGRTEEEDRNIPIPEDAKDIPSQEKPNDVPCEEEDTPTQDEPKDIPTQEEPKDIPSPEQPKDNPTQGECKPRDTTTQNEPKDIPTQEEPKDISTQDEPNNVPMQNEPNDIPTQEEESIDLPKQEEPKEIHIQEKSMDILTQEEPKDNPTQGEAKDIPTQDERKDSHTHEQPKDILTEEEPKVISPKEAPKEMSCQEETIVLPQSTTDVKKDYEMSEESPNSKSEVSDQALEEQLAITRAVLNNTPKNRPDSTKDRIQETNQTDSPSSSGKPPPKINFGSYPGFLGGGLKSPPRVTNIRGFLNEESLPAINLKSYPVIPFDTHPKIKEETSVKVSEEEGHVKVTHESPIKSDGAPPTVNLDSFPAAVHTWPSDKDEPLPNTGVKGDSVHKDHIDHRSKDEDTINKENLAVIETIPIKIEEKVELRNESIGRKDQSETKGDDKAEDEVEIVKQMKPETTEDPTSIVSSKTISENVSIEGQIDSQIVETSVELLAEEKDAPIEATKDDVKIETEETLIEMKEEMDKKFEKKQEDHLLSELKTSLPKKPDSETESDLESDHMSTEDHVTLEAGDDSQDEVDQSQAKAKENGTPESDTADFDSIQATPSQLNVEAGKQRAALRSKGSLAARRKPTRKSVRPTATDVITPPAPLQNGHADSTPTSPEQEDKPSTPESPKQPEIKAESQPTSPLTNKPSDAITQPSEPTSQATDQPQLSDNESNKDSKIVTQSSNQSFTEQSKEDTNIEPSNESMDEPVTEAHKDTNTGQAEVSQGPVLRTGKSIQGVKTAIVLPGIAEAQKAKLKSKPPVPTPPKKPVRPLPMKNATSEPALPTSATMATNGSQPATTGNDHTTSEEGNAPWMAEAQLKRLAHLIMSRPAVEELETAQQEKTETPQWMKDAERKRRRVSDLFLVSEHDKEHGEADDHSVPPWMREHAMRKANRPGPVMVTHKNLLPVTDATPTDMSANQNVATPFHAEESSLKTNDSIIDKSPPKMKADTSVVVADEKMTMMSRNSAIGINFVSSQLKSNKEILQPIKKTETSMPHSQPIQKTSHQREITSHQQIKSLDTSPEQDENKPPIDGGLETMDVPSNKSHLLPPIKAPVRSPVIDASKEKEADDPSAQSTTTTSGVVMRKKSAQNKSSYRPMTVDASMKMWETPSWKKQLVEKKKKRESIGSIPAEPENAEGEADAVLPPWQRELETKKKRQSFTTHKGNLGANKDDMPEWMKAVQKRRSRLAEKGYIVDDDNDTG